MFDESRYSAEQLRRNRMGVATFGALGVLACIIGGLATSWPMKNALGTAGLVVTFCLILWWAFASRRAGPIEVNPRSFKHLRQTFWMR